NQPRPFDSHPFANGPMTPRSPATTSTGKYVNGSMTTEKTIEYSTTLTGSTPVTMMSAASAKVIIHVKVKRAASRGFLNFPHGQPKNCARLEAPDIAVSMAAPAKAKNIPSSATINPSLPNIKAGPSAAAPGSCGSMWRGRKTCAPTTTSATESVEPRTKPTMQMTRLSVMSE